MLAWLKQYFSFYLEENIALKPIGPAVWREFWKRILFLKKIYFYIALKKFAQSSWWHQNC